MIFDVVVDGVLRHWILVVEEKEAVPEGFLRDLQLLIAYFYTDNGLLMSTQGVRIQWTFDVLVDIFDGLGLQKNSGKIVDMVFHP